MPRESGGETFLRRSALDEHDVQVPRTVDALRRDAHPYPTGLASDVRGS